MTSKERVLAAVNHRATERIPITFDAEKEVYAALHDRLGTRSKEELFDRLNVDTWMIGPRSPEAKPKAKAEKGGSMWGYRTKTTAYSGGTYDELVYSPLAGKNELSDIRNHPWPGPDALTFSHCPAEAAAHADRAIIGTFTWGAYFIATFVRGMEDLMMDFAIRPEVCRLPDPDDCREDADVSGQPAGSPPATGLTSCTWPTTTAPSSRRCSVPPCSGNWSSRTCAPPPTGSTPATRSSSSTAAARCGRCCR